MNKYEYKLADLPPLRPGGRGHDEFDALQLVLNELGMEGWEYVRRETFEVVVKRWLRAPRIDRRQKLVLRRLISTTENKADVARLVIKDKGEPLRIAPRRVRNVQKVAEIKAGSRKITVVDAVKSMAAQDGRAQGR